MSAAGTAAGLRHGTGGFNTTGHTGGARRGTSADTGLAGFLRRILGLTRASAMDEAALEIGARGMAPRAQADLRQAVARAQGSGMNNPCSAYVPGQFGRPM